MKRKNKYIERGGRDGNVRKKETEIGLLAGYEKTMSKILKGRHSQVPNKWRVLIKGKIRKSFKMSKI